MYYMPEYYTKSIPIYRKAEHIELHFCYLSGLQTLHRPTKFWVPNVSRQWAHVSWPIFRTESKNDISFPLSRTVSSE